MDSPDHVGQLAILVLSNLAVQQPWLPRLRLAADSHSMNGHDGGACVRSQTPFGFILGRLAVEGKGVVLIDLVLWSTRRGRWR